MKIYCSCCDKVQPVVIDDCRDAKTNAPFQDIVCAECRLVIASGTDISPPQREWVGLTDEEIDKTHETQVWDARRSYARAIEAKLKGKNT